MAELKDVRNDYHGVSNLTSDIDNTETNIALLAFKVAAGDSLTKFDMVDQIIEDYKDLTGVDGGNSTNEILNDGTPGGEFLHGGISAGYIVQQPQANSICSIGGYSAAVAGQLHDGNWGSNWDIADGQSWVNITIYDDLGSAKLIRRCRFKIGGGSGSYQVHGSNDASSWTLIGTSGTGSFTPNPGGLVFEFGANNLSFRYWRVKVIANSANTSSGDPSELEWSSSDTDVDNLTVVSTATTAQTEPVTGDIVMLIEDNLGTATYGSTPGTGDDLRAYVSRDDGTTWAEGTITNEGTWGTDKKILVARDIDISSQPSGQSMRYRLETYNQTPAGTIKTCTANGNVHTDTTIKKFGTASAQFDGTGDYISIPDSDDWSFGGSDFTIDMWIRPASMGNFIIIGQREAAFGWEILMSGSNIHFWTPSGNFGQDPAMSIGDITDTWTHIAIVRSGATLRMFKNGERLVMVNDATTGTGGTTMADVTSVVSIGARTGGTYYPFEGYIDEIRVSHAAHYTSNFTPSTAPYTPDSYYKLLMHMDGADSGTTFTDDYWTGKGTNIHATSLAWK